MVYLGEGGRVPYLNKNNIVRNVEETLEECWNGAFPVDVEAICDDLGIGILPIVDLSKTFRVDAFISADFKTIYVDNREFEKDSHRYRFSVAHELGHFVLHRRYCPCVAQGLDEWFRFFRRFTNDYAEFQANYFAGSLLVPEAELVRVLNNEFGGSFVRNYWNASPSELGRILMRVRRHFRVSDDVIARRMRDAFPGVDEIDNNKKWREK